MGFSSALLRGGFDASCFLGALRSMGGIVSSAAFDESCNLDALPAVNFCGGVDASGNLGALPPVHFCGGVDASCILGAFPPYRVMLS